MSYSDQDFEGIIQGCIKHDAASRKLLYDLFSKKMFSICQRYSKTKQDAEDIFQDAFLKVFKNIHQVKSSSQLPGWIKTIFINTAINFYKKELLNLTNELTDLNDIKSSDINIYEKLSYDEFILLIEQLPFKMKVVFNLYAIEGHSHQEISELLKISVGTSKSNLHDAKKKLQELIFNSNLESDINESLNTF